MGLHAVSAARTVSSWLGVVADELIGRPPGLLVAWDGRAGAPRPLRNLSAAGRNAQRLP